MGNVDIYVDGVFKQTVNCYTAGARQLEQTVYSLTGLTAGIHTIQINNSSSSKMVIDGLKIYN